MVDKKTMSVHSRAYLFLVNTADVPLTYRNFGVLQLHQFFFFFISFDKKKRVIFRPQTVPLCFSRASGEKKKFTLILSGIAPKSSRRESLKKLHV